MLPQFPHCKTVRQNKQKSQIIAYFFVNPLKIFCIYVILYVNYTDISLH